jgi:ABC-type multidrug transport system fused ATPase/permease subunit
VGSSLVGLSTWYSNLNKGAGAGDRIFELLESKALIESSSTKRLTLEGKILPAVKGDIKFCNVGFFYPIRPDAPIFKDLTFSLASGETVAVVGHSGSGKSTIAQLLMRFYDVNSGSVYIDDIPLRELDLNWMRNDIIGLVSQEPVLFATTIKENIAYGNPDATESEIIEASKRANAHEFITAFPDGYNTMVGDRGQSISGGQKQRIAIARALLKNPQILILDEATSALDAASETLVQQALDRLIEGRTVITIAHR